MDYAEEQSMEMEALSAIFLSDFTLTSPSSCTILTHPNSSISYVSCTLSFTLPSHYPDQPPLITCHGMSPSWCTELITLLQSSSRSFAGSPAVFSLVEQAKEWLTERNVQGLGEDSMHAQMLAKAHFFKMEENMKAQQLAQRAQAQSNAFGPSVRVERKVEVGTNVTPDTFRAWVEGYVKEENKARVMEIVAETGAAVRVTGRQLFEGGGVEEMEVVAVEDGEELEDFEGEEEEEEPDEKAINASG